MKRTHPAYRTAFIVAFLTILLAVPYIDLPTTATAPLLSTADLGPEHVGRYISTTITSLERVELTDCYHDYTFYQEINEVLWQFHALANLSETYHTYMDDQGIIWAFYMAVEGETVQVVGVVREMLDNWGEPAGVWVEVGWWEEKAEVGQ